MTRTWDRYSYTLYTYLIFGGNNILSFFLKKKGTRLTICRTGTGSLRPAVPYFLYFSLCLSCIRNKCFLRSLFVLLVQWLPNLFLGGITNIWKEHVLYEHLPVRPRSFFSSSSGIRNDCTGVIRCNDCLLLPSTLSFGRNIYIIWKERILYDFPRYFLQFIHFPPWIRNN